MIVFTHDPQIASKIISGSDCVSVIMNLSSAYSGYIDITPLITKLQYFNNTDLPMPDFVQSPAFDAQYASAIFNNKEMFCKLVSIMLHCREGYNVIIMVAHDFYRDAVTESLIKVIQQRYGYNCWIVNELDDVDCIKESHFTPQGLLTLDEDIFKYVEIGEHDLPNVNVE